MNTAAIRHEFADRRDEPIRLYESGIGSPNVSGDAVRSLLREPILIVETNTNFQSSLAPTLRKAGFEVMTATTGEQAFLLLRDWQCPIGWLYTQATLPGLIDGWILADQYRDNYPDRPAIIGAREVRYTARGDVVLKEPTATTVLDAVRHITISARPQASFEPVSADRRALPRRKAATDTDDPELGHQSRVNF